MSPSGSDVRPWLLIEALQETVLRFATALPSPRPRITDVRPIDIGGVPTFTDALQLYARETGIPLYGLNCAMAIAGAASGEAISLARSRWTISRTGLAAIFGTPVTIINGVAARGWAIRSGTATMESLRGFGAPNFTRAGRYLMLSVGGGVGAAVVDVDDSGAFRVQETEAGQMDFASANDRETRLMVALKGINPHVSWENMLMLERDSSIWGQACPDVAEVERTRMIANVLGRFAVNLIYAYGTWEGLLITGSRGARIVEPQNRSSFDSAFTERRSLRRLVSACPAWRIEQHEAVLTGAAECLAQSLGVALRAAA